MRVFEQRDQDLKQKIGRAWRNAHDDELRNSHLFVILRVMTTVWIRRILYSRRADKSPQFGLFFLSIIRSPLSYGSLITAIGLKATDTYAAVLLHIPQTHYPRKSFTFSHGLLHY